MDNVYQAIAGESSYYGVIPVTIDGDRTYPYIQYPFVRKGREINQPGEIGTSVPSKWYVSSTGPVFTVSFVMLSETQTGISVDDLDTILRPTICSVPLPITGDTKRVVLEWDSDNPEVSAWNTSDASSDREIDLENGKQYCVATKPISPILLASIPAGVVNFSLEPVAGVNTFDGMQIGILAATHTFMKQEAAD